VTDAELRVLFADVSGAGRRAIAALLRSMPGVVLVAEAGTTDELARESRRTAPDAIVIDDRLLAAPGLGPRDADVPVIVVGLDDDPSFARRARRLGALAWIAKERADELLPEALDRAQRQRGASAGPSGPTG
jgi:DNA-binding NarL/FixJ family response regulator